MIKKIKKFVFSERSIAKTIFTVIMGGILVISFGGNVFAYFQRIAVDSNFIDGWGYGYNGSAYGYGYGYGYGASISNNEDYGFWGSDGKATSVSASALGSSGVSVSYSNDYYAKNKVYYSATSAACASLSSNTTQTSFQTGSQSVSITGLTPSTTYYYCVASEDVGGNVWHTTVGSVSTTAGGGTGGGGGAVPVVETPTIATQTTVASVTASSGGNIALTTSEGSKVEVVILAAAATVNLSVTVQSKSAATVEAAGTVGTAPASLYRVGSLVFEVSATNASTSAAVTQFSKDITLSFTYTDAQIAGLSEDSLKIYTWQNGVWTALESTVDKTNNKITAKVSHLTYFSIMGQKVSTTTVATTTPTTVATTTAITQMTIAEVKAKIKEVLALLVSLLSQLIEELKSQLQAMIAAQQTGSLTALGSLDVNLEYGDSGEAVKLLQMWLAKDAAIYPEGIVNGIFGSLTKAAVIKFQEKYKDEILTPVGLTFGNGFVGAGTRAKLNGLYGSQ